MTGRQLIRRPGYEIDIEKVLKACAEHGVAVSRLMRIRGSSILTGVGTRKLWIMLHPQHQSRRAFDQGAQWGVEMARKGGVQCRPC